jgi:hypothetical protein
MDLQPTLVEADCATLIHALGKVADSRSQWAGVITEIQVLGHLLPACRYDHIRREANQVAHALAQRALGGGDAPESST